ncbi:MAG: hypothetical protein HYW89_00420 [Candidatus Sungiibacteriota bacterium]|uniref:Uncharacterized protein n=1 Tax=Candidatus Sungiibacteriota bacterium TaxID=2750080 RepID=A0A7T5UQP6_9BACT|nr:MAG: hypothetical protein HYW89_00420 [Candidatus Sungbacteria bacterium]
MLSWRARKQLTVLLIIAVIIVGLGFLIVPKFLPEATCFDNKKNKNEFDIDCGGSCAPCELRNPKPLSIFWTRAVIARPGTYDVAAEAQNLNEELSSANVEYEFSLFDGLGLISRKTGKTFILPQERLHLIETNLVTTRAPNRVELRILNAEWQVNQVDKPNLIVERRDYKVMEENGLKQSVIEVSIFNRSVPDYRKVEVNFTVLDKEGNLLGVNKVLLEDLFSNSRKVVKSIWPEELRGVADTIIIEPRVNVFDPSAIQRP